MPIQKRTLSVYPNPYVGVDHMGRPASAVQVEPDIKRGDANLHYVGATRVVAQLTKGEPQFGIEPTHDISFVFSPAPVEVMNTQYYHHCIRSRDLIAADVESWMACGLPRASFVEPELALEHAKAGAIASYAAHYDNEDGAAETPAALASHWDHFHYGLKADAKPEEIAAAKKASLAKKDADAAEALKVHLAHLAKLKATALPPTPTTTSPNKSTTENL